MIKNVLFIFVFLNTFSYAENFKAYKLFIEGLVLENENNFDEALNKFNEAIKLDKNEEIYKQALNISINTGKMKESLDYAKFLVEKDTSSENFYLYGNSLWANGKNEEAIKAFEKAIEIDKNNYEAYYNLSVLNSRDIKKSIYYLNKFIELRPELKPEAYLQMAEVYYSAKDKEKMVEYLKKSAEEDPSFLKPRYMLAVFYEENGNVKEAIKEYEEILKVNPNNLEILKHLGEIYLSNDFVNLNKAENYFSKILTIVPDDKEAIYWLAIINEMNKNYEKAIYYMEKLEKILSNPINIIKISYYYSAQDKSEKAFETLKEGAKKWPKDSEINYFLALGYENEGKNKKAIKILKNLIKDNTSYIKASMELGILCEKENDIACFKENFERVIKEEPKNHIALNYLGYSLINRGLELEKGKKMIEEALSLDPMNPAYLDSLAWYYYKIGDFKKAKEEMDKSLKLFFQEPLILEHAGDIYQENSNYDKAWFFYKFSYILNNKKEVLKKINKLSEKINISKEMKNYLNTFSLIKKDFSAMAKVYLNIGGEKVILDGILVYKNDESFSFSILGPFLSEIWKIKYDKDIKSVDGQLIGIEGLNEEIINNYSFLVFDNIYNYFKGYFFNFDSLKDKEANIGNFKVNFTKDEEYIKEIEEKDNKFKIKIKDIFINDYLIPESFEFHFKHLNIKIELDKKTIKIKGNNEIDLWK